MLLDRAHGPGVYVRGRAHLEGNALITHVGREPAHRQLPIVGHGYVIDDAHPVAQSVRATPLQRLPDRREAERFAGMDRQVEVCLVDQVEGIEIARRRVSGLGPGYVEANDALVAVTDGELGDLD